MQTNHDFARKQLAYLKGRLTFQTFHDVKIPGVVKNVSLTKVIHGSYEDVYRQLEKLNDSGAGIYISVNETNGLGRTSADIINIRAVVTDYDGILPPPFPISPTFTIISKNGPQHWWITNGLNHQNYQGVQKHLIKLYQSDPKVWDLPRVLRLAGYQHLKNPKEPFLVKFQEGSGKIYSALEIIAAFPPLIESIPVKSPTTGTRNFSTTTTKYEVTRRGLMQVRPIFHKCDAFARIKDKVQNGSILSHEEGFALFHLCIQFEGGPEWFISRVPGWGKTRSDLAQLQHSIDKKYYPWSCSTLQFAGVCRFKEKCHCMPISRSGLKNSQPNPIRFAGQEKSQKSEKLVEILNFIKKGGKDG